MTLRRHIGMKIDNPRYDPNHSLERVSERSGTTRSDVSIFVNGLFI
jgi:hypothetical protein